MPERSCPSCAAEMTQGRMGPILLDVCLPCGGVWFDRGELSEVITAGPHVVRRLYDTTQPRGASPGTRRLGLPRCPCCHVGMEGKQYAGMNGVDLDACPFCEGVWAGRTALKRMAGVLEGISVPDQIAAEAAGLQPGAVRTTSPLPAPPDPPIPCPGCGEANVRSAPTCWACAKPLLGPVVGHCPACQGSMRQLECQGLTVNGCEGCGSVFTNPGRLNALLRQPPEQLRAWIAGPLDRLGHHSPAVGTLLTCPQCQIPMGYARLAALSPHPVATCERCYGMLLAREVFREIVLRAAMPPVPVVQEVPTDTVVAQGLEERLKQARLIHNWRGLLGFSPSTGRSFHAIRFESTGQVTVLLLPTQPGNALAVPTLPSDVRWEG